MAYKLKLLVALLFPGPVMCYSQPGRIDTDRPDQTESAVTMPKKWVQFELGLQVQKNISTENEYLLPTLLTKYGLTKKIELRLITSLKRYQAIQSNGATVYENGIEPVLAGVKVALAEEKNWFPKTSLLFHLVLPTIASQHLKADKLAPHLLLSMQHSIAKNMGLGYNLGAEWDGYTNEPGWIYSISPGFDLGEKWYTYIEAFGVVSKTAAPQHNIDGGLAYYINPNFKTDISFGYGISRTAPLWYLALGASIRFNTDR